MKNKQKKSMGLLAAFLALTVTFAAFQTAVRAAELVPPQDTETTEALPQETEPEATELVETNPEETEPEQTEPAQTEPEVTEPETTEPEATEPAGEKAVTTGD